MLLTDADRDTSHTVFACSFLRKHGALMVRPKCWANDAGRVSEY